MNNCNLSLLTSNGFIKPFVAIDLEFLTYRYFHNRRKEYIQDIVEIGALFYKDEQISEYSTIIKPRIHNVYQIDSKNFNKIPEEEINYGIDIEEALQRIKRFTKENEDFVWVSWGGSDCHTLTDICQRYMIDTCLDKHNYVDLSICFRNAYKMRQTVSLDKAMQRLNLPEIEDRHRALGDTRALVSVLFKMIEQGFIL